MSMMKNMMMKMMSMMIISTMMMSTIIMMTSMTYRRRLRPADGHALLPNVVDGLVAQRHHEQLHLPHVEVVQLDVLELRHCPR